MNETENNKQPMDCYVLIRGEKTDVPSEDGEYNIRLFNQKTGGPPPSAGTMTFYEKHKLYVVSLDVCYSDNPEVIKNFLASEAFRDLLNSTIWKQEVDHYGMNEDLTVVLEKRQSQ